MVTQHASKQEKSNHFILFGFSLDLAKFGDDISFHMKNFHIATAETSKHKEQRLLIMKIVTL